MSENLNVVRQKAPIILIVLMLTFWTGSLVFQYRSSSEAEEYSFALLREADVSLRLTRVLEDKPRVQQIIMSYAPIEEARGDFLEVFKSASLQGDLDLDGIKAYKYLLAWHTEDYSEINLKEIQRTARNGYLWSWEAEVLKAMTDEAPSMALGYDQELDDEIYRLTFNAYALNIGVMLLGLPFIGSALKCFIKSGREKVESSELTGNWSWVLVAIIAITLVDDLVIGLFYSIIPQSLWEKYPLLLEVSLDGVWRFIAPICLILLFIVNRHKVFSSLGLDKVPALKPVLGMLSLAILYDGILFRICMHFDLVEWATISSYEDGYGGLVYAFMSGVIFAPVAEEIVYRGFMFDSLRKRSSFMMAMAVSTVFFVMIHYYGWYGCFSVAAFGVAACALYSATRSLWTAIIYHALMNLLITACFWPIYHGFYSL